MALRVFQTDDLPALFSRLRGDSTLMFHSRDEVIRAAEAAVGRAKAAMPRWFGRLPRSDVIVDPCLPFEEKSGCPNSYVSGTADGAGPGRWRINAGVDPPQLMVPLEGTAFHETIPGHHLQGALAQERAGAHPLTRYLFFSGFGEGWALYAERLADTMGLYSSELLSLRRARRAGASGGAAGGGSGPGGIWMVAAAGDRLHAGAPDVRPADDRIGGGSVHRESRPGDVIHGRQARNRAPTPRGARPARPAFDIRQFHDRVLESGNVRCRCFGRTSRRGSRTRRSSRQSAAAR